MHQGIKSIKSIKNAINAFLSILVLPLAKSWSAASLLSSDLSDEALAKSEALAKGDARPIAVGNREPLFQDSGVSSN
jgi:hypothetical protein